MISLGPFQLEHPFILAPMAGITHSPFRQMMRGARSALVVSELVSANGLEYGGERTLDLLRFDASERTLGLQIFGERDDLLVKACQKVEELGADFVDLNLGCPVPKVVKKGAGSAMCRDPRRLHQTLSAMVKSVRIPVTIKIRTGWNQDERNALESIRAAEDAGVAWVAIHGRTRAQGYSGEADWDFIGQLKAKSSIPIIGNGDISTPESAVSRYRDYGVDAVMIGRGALRNPFIFQQSEALYLGRTVPEKNAIDLIELLASQRELFENYFDPYRAMIQSKKFIAWYSAGYSRCHEFRKQVFQQKDPDVLWGMTEEFFRARPVRSAEYLNQPFLMGGHG